MNVRKVLIFLCMLLIMYGIKQVHRMYVRLATGSGGLKPTWILAPVAVRFSGHYSKLLEPSEQNNKTFKLYDNMKCITSQLIASRMNLSPIVLYIVQLCRDVEWVQPVFPLT